MASSDGNEDQTADDSEESFHGFNGDDKIAGREISEAIQSILDESDNIELEELMHFAGEVLDKHQKASGPPNEDSQETTRNLSSMKVDELRKELKDHGLVMSGIKSILIERLMDHLNNETTNLGCTKCVASQTSKQDEPVETWDIQVGKASVIKRIPKASRFIVARRLTELLEDVVNKNDQDSWTKLYSFASSCLGKPRRGGKKKKSLATFINQQVQNGRSEASEGRRTDDKRNSPKMGDRITAKLAVADVKGAVTIITSNDRVLPATEDVRQKLEAKHPPPHPATAMPPQEDSTEGLMITNREEVRKGILSFRNGSAAGEDAMYAQFLKDLTSEAVGEPGIQLLEALVDFYNKIVFPGKVPDQIRMTFYGAKLIGLSKIDFGVRPIAIGLTLRRLASKIFMMKNRDLSGNLLRPHQMGTGTPKGAEICVHTIRKYVMEEKKKNVVVFKNDIKNAFNCLRRDKMLNDTKKYVPEAYPFFWQAYAKPSRLSLDDEHHILSQEGIQQGDPAGPFLFSIATLDLTRSCNSDLNLWYLDDTTLGDEYETVLSDFKKILDAKESHGLEVNSKKCELLILNPESEEKRMEIFRSFQELAPDIRLISKEELTLLGAPIFPEAISSTLETKLESLKLMCERLREIDSHDALYLLRHAFFIPKLTYLLRTSPCYKETELLEKFDEEVRKTLERILNIKLEGRIWEQSTLPVSLGGLGVRKAADISLPAFLSSSFATMEEVNSLLPDRFEAEISPYVEEAKEEWKKNVQPGSVVKDPKEQADWDEPVNIYKYEKLRNSATSMAEKARIHAVAAEGSSDWLKAIPVSSLSLKLDNSSLRISCALRLGANLCDHHTCSCGANVDQLGHHGLSCKQSAGRHERHSHVNELIKRALISADVSAVREPVGLSRIDGKRPDGKSTFPFKDGKYLIWDFVCNDTFAASYLSDTSRAAGKASEDGEKKKIAKYANLTNDYYFVPIGVETMGVWGPNGLKFIKDIGSRIANISGEKRATSFLMQSISMAIQRGNAASVKGTIRDHRKLDEIFYL